MAKNNKNTKTTKENKKAATKPSANTSKKTEIPPTPQTEETVDVEEVETPATTETTAGTVMNMMTGHVPGGLDANRRVDLNGQIIKMFHDDPMARQKFGGEICDAMDDIARCGIICALADEAINGNSTFAAVLKSSQYPALVVAANQMGIKLPALKALPAGEEEGTVVVDSTKIGMSKEAKKTLEEEHKVSEEGDNGEIELDPIKVAHLDEEALKKALHYLMITGPKTHHKVNKGLIDAVDFMRDYRMEMARQAQNSTEAMNRYDDRTMYEWLADIFSYVPKPTFLIGGIGKGMKMLVARDGNPVNAFLIFRGALIDKKTGIVAWDDQSIADATLAIVELMCNNSIKENKAAIEALDTKHKDYESVKKSYQDQIDADNEILKSLVNFDFSLCEKYLTEETNAEINKTFGKIMAQYYPLCDCQGSHYVNLLENLRQRAGIILNLFRTEDNRNQNYSESNLLDVYVQFPGGEKRSLEEWAAVDKKDRDSMVAEAEKKAKAEKKKEESKNA